MQFGVKVHFETKTHEQAPLPITYTHMQRWYKEKLARCGKTLRCWNYMELVLQVLQVCMCLYLRAFIETKETLRTLHSRLIVQQLC